MKRIVLIVLDSCGCGGAPDAEAFGDAGADTLGHTAQFAGGISLPNLAALGLGNISEIDGVSPAMRPTAAFGRMSERSLGKDTTTGHWEIAGIETTTPFKTYTDGFPQSLIDEFIAKTGREVLGNSSASGTEIIERLGPQHIETGKWIVYTSVDSVFQIAAHEDVVPLNELYRACEIARELCDPLYVGRVIARPFVGKAGAFSRTYNRHDYGMLPPSDTVLDQLVAAEKNVVAVGKISDIFSGRGISSSVRTAGNLDGLEKTEAQLKTGEPGLIFVNLIDFDSLYGHRRDPAGFAAALKDFDEFIPRLLSHFGEDDLLMITADHGNDPTFAGSDHTREQVPLIVYGPTSATGVDLGVRDGFWDIAATIAEAFDVENPGGGASFLKAVYRP